LVWREQLAICRLFLFNTLPLICKKCKVSCKINVRQFYFLLNREAGTAFQTLSNLPAPDQQKKKEERREKNEQPDLEQSTAEKSTPEGKTVSNVNDDNSLDNFINKR
jgi:hypothetical protein